MATEQSDFFDHPSRRPNNIAYWELLAGAAERGWFSFCVGSLVTESRLINVVFRLQESAIRVPDTEEVTALIGLGGEDGRITLSHRTAAPHHELNGFSHEPVVHFNGTFGQVLRALVDQIPDATVARVA